MVHGENLALLGFWMKMQKEKQQNNKRWHFYSQQRNIIIHTCYRSKYNLTLNFLTKADFQFPLST